MTAGLSSRTGAAVGRMGDVQRLGQPSWSLTTSSGGGLDALLHLRDALRLPADPATDPPVWDEPLSPAWPRDVEGPGARAAVRGAHGWDREVTAVAWRSWWRDSVARAFSMEGVDLRGSALAPEWARRLPPVRLAEPAGLADLSAEGVRRRFEPLVQHARDLEPVGSGGPPGFVGLADPVLRQAATARWAAAEQWAADRADARHGDLVAEDVEEEEEEAVAARRREHELLRSTAEDVAFDTGAPIERVRAHLLLIEGPRAWSQPWAPGAVLASHLAMADPATARPLLHAAFRSAATAT